MLFSPGYVSDVSEDEASSPPRSRTSAPESRLKIHDLPAHEFWGIVLGTVVLSVVGGCMNGLALAGVFKLAVTHVTGSTTMSAIDVVFPGRVPSDQASYFWGHLLFYTLGSMVGGFVIQRIQDKWRGRQSTVLGLEALVLWAAVLAQQRGHSFVAAYCMASAAGLQNSVTSCISIISIRTCNVTGTVVDIGTAIPLIALDGWAKHSWRLKLWVAMFAAFWIGALLGALGFRELGDDVLYVPAVSVTLLSAASWIWTVDRKRTSRKALPLTSDAYVPPPIS